MACPKCSAVSAMPNMALTGTDGGTTVGMHCRHCGHEWRFDMPASTDATRMRSGVRLPIAKPPANDPTT